MNISDQIHLSFFNFLKKTYELTDDDLATIAFDLNTDEQKQAFGDITCNAPLILAKKLAKKPQEIAQLLVHNFKCEYIQKIDIAGPGFLNFFFTPQAYGVLVCTLFENFDGFFKPAHQVKKHHYSLEFVSANPTGPLHLGHGRGGIIGDVLANILLFLNHKVTKEYYINDAGSQIEKLGNSFKIRCQQQIGIDAQLPEDGYQGEYLQDLSKICLEKYGDALLEQPDYFFADYAKNAMLEQIKITLKTYGITFDLWFSEKTLHDNGSIEKALELLEQKDCTYQKDGALWFKGTQFGDEKDRVLRKQSGELTYISADIAYTQNKFNRTDRLIMVLGQDHHSYLTRLKGITKALGFDPNNLEIILYQLVTLKESGQQLRMSKRAGTMVTLKEVIETVGRDVARFFFLNRKADAHLDFNLDLALKKTEENPVYYVQYAYVRTKSILKNTLEKDKLKNISSTDALCLGNSEYLLIKKIIFLKNLLTSIAYNNQTHLLTYYVIELAQLFHSYYAKNKVIDMNNIPQSRMRLLLIEILKNTFELCLDILGLSKPEKM